MLSITVEQVSRLLREGDEDVTPGTGWVTLLALGLLSSMRNPRSPLMPYLAMLPAPEGSRLAAVCRHGPAATDLMFFRSVGAGLCACVGVWGTWGGCLCVCMCVCVCVCKCA
jgi:hypothetical protein